MNFKHISAGAALGLAVLASPAAVAGSLTGNVGVVSDYMFRGVDQSTQGAAVQGGVDYVTDIGLYMGAWFSNASAANGNEADLYVGYNLQAGPFNLDGGVIQYLYTEDTENVSTVGIRNNLDYTEIYLGGAVGPIALKLFYAPEFSADINNTNGDGTTPNNVSGDPEKNEMLYVTASANLALTDTLSFMPHIGFTSGDGAKDAFGDEYLDYGISVVKRLQDDMSVSLELIGTDIEIGGTGSGNNDNPKFVIGFKKNFKI